MFTLHCPKPAQSYHTDAVGSLSSVAAPSCGNLSKGPEPKPGPLLPSHLPTYRLCQTRVRTSRQDQQWGPLSKGLMAASLPWAGSPCVPGLVLEAGNRVHKVLGGRGGNSSEMTRDTEEPGSCWPPAELSGVGVGAGVGTHDQEGLGCPSELGVFPTAAGSAWRARHPLQEHCPTTWLSHSCWA